MCFSPTASQHKGSHVCIHLDLGVQGLFCRCSGSLFPFNACGGPCGPPNLHADECSIWPPGGDSVSEAKPQIKFMFLCAIGGPRVLYTHRYTHTVIQYTHGYTVHTRLYTHCYTVHTRLGYTHTVIHTPRHSFGVYWRAYWRVWCVLACVLACDTVPLCCCERSLKPSAPVELQLLPRC